jgi:hypothetical protein
VSLAERLKVIAAMKPKNLRSEWERVHRVPAPPGFGPDLLARGLAYTAQQKARGGLASEVAREIRRGVADLAATSVLPDRAPSLRPGTRLTREWHGRTHHVHVVERGFEYRDKPYRSLTAIAREITGARWSGPRFFGLAGSGRV